MPGRTLGHYRILEQLGAGGMGEVYRAEDTVLKRQVALKMLPPELAADRERLDRFQREAEALAALNHPNIVTIHSVEEAEGVHFLTMELIEGQSLAEAIPPRGLNLERIFAIAEPLADALAAAHARGVIHRDLKPRNVMLTGEGRVKVVDFGLAKQLREPAPVEATALPTEPLTGEGRILGTLPYMSPEQLDTGELDARSDLFSLGVILFELATGERPFGGRSPASVISSILRDEPPSVDRLRGDLPHHLGRIVSHCLEKRPEDRLQSALDVRNELRALRRETESGERGPARPRPPLSPPAGPRRRAPWIAGALAAAALAAALALALRLLPSGAAPPSPPRALPPAGSPPSVAVLPLTDLSPAGDQAYFADGLADELIGALARIPGLRVAGRTSAFQFRDRPADPREIGARLNVSALLEGSVRKSGDRVRITTQLINAADGFELWSRTYERELADIFAVQDDIARSVAAALEVTLLGAGTPGPARAANAEAYTAYLRGRYFATRRTREGLAKAADYFQQALDLEPGNAAAWAALAEARIWQSGFGWVAEEEGWADARAAVDRALELDNASAEGWAVQGLISSWRDWDWEAAEAAFARAVELKPADPEILRRAAAIEAILGRLEEAIGLARRAVEIDPLDMLAYHSLGGYLYFAGRLEEADEQLAKSLELNPEQLATHMLRTMVHLARSRPEAALAEAELEADPGLRLCSLALAYTALDRHEDAAAALELAIDGYGHLAAYQIAEVYAYMGDADRTFAWLDRAYAQRDGGLTEVQVDPLMAPLHTDPRWPALLERLGLAAGVL